MNLKGIGEIWNSHFHFFLPKEKSRKILWYFTLSIALRTYGGKNQHGRGFAAFRHNFENEWICFVESCARALDAFLLEMKARTPCAEESQERNVRNAVIFFFDWALIHLVYLSVGALQLSHCSSGRLGEQFLNPVSGGKLGERDKMPPYSSLPFRRWEQKNFVTVEKGFASNPNDFLFFFS